MTINQEIVLSVQLSTDGKGFKRVGTAHTPWETTSEFLDNTATTRRHEGMFAYVRNGSDIDIWHFVGGIAGTVSDNGDLVKYGLSAVNCIVEKASNDDFPTIGDDQHLYINTTTKLPYIWVGSAYELIGTAALLQTNDLNNDVQNNLNIIDSNTIGASYQGAGKLRFYTLLRVLVNVKVGTSDAIAAGILEGGNTFTNARLIGNQSECFRSGQLIADFDLGDGTENAIKDTDFTLNSDTITFSSNFYDGEWIKIKIV